MIIEIVRVIMATMLVGLITGKAIVSAIAHVIAWTMSKLADMGKFDVMPKVDYMKFYTECNGPDIEH